MRRTPWRIDAGPGRVAARHRLGTLPRQNRDEGHRPRASRPPGSRLRAWREDDLEPLARLNADPLAMRHMGRGPLDLDETRRQLERFHAHWDEHGFGLWAIEDRETGAFLGRTGVSYHAVWPDDPEVGWFLDPKVWGRRPGN